jgi:hypothetical protein
MNITYHLEKWIKERENGRTSGNKQQNTED